MFPKFLSQRKNLYSTERKESDERTRLSSGYVLIEAELAGEVIHKLKVSIT